MAIVHSRLTVAGEIPNAAAVSSTVRPPKKRSSTIFRFVGIDLFELLQRPVEIERFDRVERGGCGRNGLVQRDRQAAPAPLLTQLVARLVDEMRRINWAATAKKCPRFCQSTVSLNPR